jgi:hypothetical protein
MFVGAEGVMFCFGGFTSVDFLYECSGCGEKLPGWFERTPMKHVSRVGNPFNLVMVSKAKGASVECSFKCNACAGRVSFLCKEAA